MVRVPFNFTNKYSSTFVTIIKLFKDGVSEGEIAEFGNYYFCQFLQKELKDVIDPEERAEIIRNSFWIYDDENVESV